jgi:hypothetical protein
LISEYAAVASTRVRSFGPPNSERPEEVLILCGKIDGRLKDSQSQLLVSRDIGQVNWSQLSRNAFDVTPPIRQAICRLSDTFPISRLMDKLGFIKICANKIGPSAV